MISAIHETPCLARAGRFPSSDSPLSLLFISQCDPLVCSLRVNCYSKMSSLSTPNPSIPRFFLFFSTLLLPIFALEQLSALFSRVIEANNNSEGTQLIDTYLFFFMRPFSAISFRSSSTIILCFCLFSQGVMGTFVFFCFVICALVFSLQTSSALNP